MRGHTCPVPVIETRSLCKVYQGNTALVDLTMSIDRGVLAAVLGPNGAGKSTTSKILAALLPPTRGAAIIAGFDVASAPLEVKRRVGYLPETPVLYEVLTARECVEFAARLRGLSVVDADRRMRDLFVMVGVRDAADQQLRVLSKGTRQKIALCIALIHGPEVLILDEPLDGVDIESAIVIKALLKQLAASGVTILLSTHMIDLAESLADKVFLLLRGQLIGAGTPVELCRSLGATSLEEAIVRRFDIAPATQLAAEFAAKFRDI